MTHTEGPPCPNVFKEHYTPQFGWTSMKILCPLNPKSQLWFFKLKRAVKCCWLCTLHPTQYKSLGTHSFHVQFNYVNGAVWSAPFYRWRYWDFLRSKDWQLDNGQVKIPTLVYLLPKLVLFPNLLHCHLSYFRVEVHSPQLGNESLLVILARNCRSLYGLLGRTDIYLDVLLTPHISQFISIKK